MQKTQDKKHRGESKDPDSRIRIKERLVKEAGKFNLLSNIFMSVALGDKAACQHVLRILLGIEDLVVWEVRTQYRISKQTSHDAILDILAEDSEGTLYQIEIQREDTIDHARRTRFYGSMVDSEYLMKGKTYRELPDVYLLYISETDLWKQGHLEYPVEKRFKNTRLAYEDGLHIIYINAAIDDGSAKAKLMKYFRTADPNDMSQGELSKWVHYLKCEEGGQEIMCEVSERIYSMGLEEGIAEGREEGREEGRAEGIEEGQLTAKHQTALNMSGKGYDISTIAEILEVSAGKVKQWLEVRSVLG